MKDDIVMIPIDRIRILNPRPRDKKKFEQIVRSIQNLGLKKPIQVSQRSAQEGDEPGYDLVCGQGRIEAFLVLGHKEIPAIVVDIPREERLLRSLVENMARRLPPPLALMNEIERLKEDGYSNVEIGEKLDMDDNTVGGYLALKRAGEERLLDAAINGRIPLGVAMDIAKADSPELQRGLLKAYESKQLNQCSIRTVKRLMDQRRFVGKERDRDKGASRRRTSAESLINAYKRESQRQKLWVKKARVCEAKLMIIVTAFSKLLADENFVNLLRAESLADVPKYLHDKLAVRPKEPYERNETGI
jgi:ParB family chromosome partitioning protein